MREPYQMEKQNNYKNTFQKGITAAENYGTNRMHDTGVPLIGFKGVPQDQGRGQFGIPIPGAGNVSQREAVKPRCMMKTKKGDPCKANPMRGDVVCVGHSRVVDTDRALSLIHI